MNFSPAGNVLLSQTVTDLSSVVAWFGSMAGSALTDNIWVFDPVSGFTLTHCLLVDLKNFLAKCHKKNIRLEDRSSYHLHIT